MICPFFFFNDTATTEIYTLSLHDALPISPPWPCHSKSSSRRLPASIRCPRRVHRAQLRSRCSSISVVDRKSTRLNSSHSQISYAVFCLKKKKKKLCSIISLQIPTESCERLSILSREL